MTDIGFDEPIRADFIYPFWLSHSKEILGIRKAINFPKTSMGKQIAVNQERTPVFLAYNRLSEILPSIISIIEYDEIFTKQGDEFFKIPLIKER